MINEKKEFNLALVTGASSGIGEYLSYLLADKGIDLIIHGRNAEKLEEVAKKLRTKVNVSILIAELADKDGKAKVVEAIHKQKPDLVVNNAGIGLYGEALTYETAKQLEVFNVDGAALLELSLEAARTMISAGTKGVILNVSSVAAWPIFPGFAVYGATKAFVNQFSESFDEETKPHGVRVLSVCPGVVDTNFRGTAEGTKSKKEMTPMTSEFVAQEIWNQIERREKIRIIDWRYRMLMFFVKYVFPKKMVANIVGKGVKQISKHKEIIKIK